MRCPISFPDFDLRYSIPIIDFDGDFDSSLKCKRQRITTCESIVFCVSCQEIHWPRAAERRACFAVQRHPTGKKGTRTEGAEGKGRSQSTCKLSAYTVQASTSHRVAPLQRQTHEEEEKEKCGTVTSSAELYYLSHMRTCAALALGGHGTGGGTGQATQALTCLPFILRVAVLILQVTLWICRCTVAAVVLQTSLNVLHMPLPWLSAMAIVSGYPLQFLAHARWMQGQWVAMLVVAALWSNVHIQPQQCRVLSAFLGWWLCRDNGWSGIVVAMASFCWPAFPGKSVVFPTALPEECLAQTRPYRNLGASCWINAPLQALFASMAVKSFLRRHFLRKGEQLANMWRVATSSDGSTKETASRERDDDDRLAVTFVATALGNPNDDLVPYIFTHGYYRGRQEHRL